MSGQPPLPPTTEDQAGPSTASSDTSEQAPATPKITCANLPLQSFLKIKVEPEETVPKSDTCRKFIWGICDKQAQCKFVHKLDIEEMKKTLKFCHDHQNKGGCIREGCTYLHITKEEENLFYTRNVIPTLLVERHEAMAKGVVPAKENKTKQKLFVNENFIKPAIPPPPPPPPPPSSVRPHVPQSTAPPIATVPPQHAPIQAVRPTIPLTPFIPPQHPRMYSGPVNTVRPAFPANNPRPALSALPPMCDLSRPPPPLPQPLQNGHNSINYGASTSTDMFPIGSKRKWPFDAGGCKIVNGPAGSQTTEGYCDGCVQLETRIGQYNKEIEKVLVMKVDKNFIYEKKLAEYKKGKNMLIAAVGPEYQRMLDEYIEGVPECQLSNGFISQWLQNQSISQPSFIANSAPNAAQNVQTILQMLEVLLSPNSSSKSVIDPIKQTEQGPRPHPNTADDNIPVAIRQCLNNLSRRISINQSPQQGENSLLYEIVQQCQHMLGGETGTNGVDILNSTTNRPNISISASPAATPNMNANFPNANAFEPPVPVPVTNTNGISNVPGTAAQYGNGTNYVMATSNGSANHAPNQTSPNPQAHMQNMYLPGHNATMPPPAVGYYAPTYAQPQAMVPGPQPNAAYQQMGYQYPTSSPLQGALPPVRPPAQVATGQVVTQAPNAPPPAAYSQDQARRWRQYQAMYYPSYQ